MHEAVVVGVGLGQGVEYRVLRGHCVSRGGARGGVVPGEYHHAPPVMETCRQQEVVVTVADNDDSSSSSHTMLSHSPQPGHDGRSLWLPVLQPVLAADTQVSPVGETSV